MGGAVPVVDIDFDGDGVTDLVALGEPGTAVLYRGVAKGFEESRKWTVPRFTLVVPLPSSSLLALVSEGARGTTRLTLLSR